MAGSLFAFFRATFYRFVPLFLAACPDLAKAPKLLAVGDLHVENFGTWRDSEGRLIWGVNDFEETSPMPYAIDLVRLVASAIIAKEANGLAIEAQNAAAAVLAGYTATLESGGTAFVLEENHPNLRAMALSTAREPTKFWPKLMKLPAATPPKRARHLLTSSLPKGATGIAYTTRIAGEGSLGRPRYVATANCNGGLAAREVKAWLPSAWGWARGKPKDTIFALRLLKRAVRQPDPYYTVEHGWVVRRLGPYCGRIELTDFPAHRDEKAILKAMGQETANLHLATPSQREAVLRDIGERQPDWLFDAAHAMVKATKQDWKDFQASSLAKSGMSRAASS
jgi:hypothetical protein